MSTTSPPDFTAKEYQALDDILAGLGSDHGFKFLFAQYERLVNQLEGYAFSIYDYDNDLSARTWLDLALAKCDPELQIRVRESVAPLDEAFQDQTAEFPRSRYPESEPDSKWHRRLPRNPGPDLASDIVSGNL